MGPLWLGHSELDNVREPTVDIPNRRRSFGIVAGLCAAAISVTLGATPASAQLQDDRYMPAVSTKPQKQHVRVARSPDATRPADTTRAAAENKPLHRGGGRYYVDFRSRTAASYGHAFIWYGNTSNRKVEVAGLHPATDSVIPYMIGHILPVASETGKSYGDLDEQYLTASYRVYLTEPEAKRVFAYIQQLEASVPVWTAYGFSCTWFVGKVASYMGLRTPISHVMYPENYINEIKRLNGGRQTLGPATASVPAQRQHARALHAPAGHKPSQAPPPKNAELFPDERVQ
jgi:hypothetical protein